jgi:hypothetical protein
VSQYLDPSAQAFTRQGIYLVGEAVTFQRAVGQPPNVTLAGVTTVTAKVMTYAPDTTQQAATGYSASQIGNVTIGDRTIFVMSDDLAGGGFPLPVQKGDQVLLNDPVVGTGERLVVTQVDMAKRGFAGCIELKAIGAA